MFELQLLYPRKVENGKPSDFALRNIEEVTTKNKKSGRKTTTLEMAVNDLSPEQLAYSAWCAWSDQRFIDRVTVHNGDLKFSFSPSVMPDPATMPPLPNAHLWKRGVVNRDERGLIKFIDIIPLPPSVDLPGEKVVVLPISYFERQRTCLVTNSTMTDAEKVRHLRLCLYLNIAYMATKMNGLPLEERDKLRSGYDEAVRWYQQQDAKLAS